MPKLRHFGSATSAVSRFATISMALLTRLTLAVALLPAISVAQLTLHVPNEPSAITITASDLSKLPRHSVKVSEHGTDVTFDGVSMHDVLARPEVPLGKALRGQAMSCYVLATGRDGYAVVFSLTEFDPAFQDSDILLADKRDGKPLNEKEGPLRLIVPHDKKPARSVRMLERIDVVELRK